MLFIEQKICPHYISILLEPTILSCYVYNKTGLYTDMHRTDWAIQNRQFALKTHLLLNLSSITFKLARHFLYCVMWQNLCKHQNWTVWQVNNGLIYDRLTHLFSMNQTSPSSKGYEIREYFYGTVEFPNNIIRVKGG